MKYKLLPLVLLGTTFSLAAAAQNAVAPVPVAAAADGPVVGVNPYTGNSLTIEQLARELDTAKTNTAILEEKVKQAALNADLDIVPAKKRAEGAQYLKLTRPGVSTTDAPLAVTEAPKLVKVVKAIAPVEVAPQAPQIKITSIIGSGLSATVLLEANGQSFVAKNGEQTPYGLVRFENDSTLIIGNQKLYLPSKMLARMTISDPTPAEKDTVSVTSTLFTATPGTSSHAVGLPPPIPAPPSKN
jgi:hypothetical protein